MVEQSKKLVPSQQKAIKVPSPRHSNTLSSVQHGIMSGTVSDQIYATKDTMMPQGHLLSRQKVSLPNSENNKLLPQIDNLSQTQTAKRTFYSLQGLGNKQLSTTQGQKQVVHARIASRGTGTANERNSSNNSSSSPSQPRAHGNGVYKNVRNLSNLYNYDASVNDYEQTMQRQLRLGLQRADLTMQRNVLPPIVKPGQEMQNRNTHQIMKRVKDGKVEPVLTQQSITESTRQLNSKQLIKDSEDLDLSLIKPVLRRNFFHMGNSVIVTWKSFEIWLIHQDASLQTKINNPLYLPLTTTHQMLKMNEQDFKTLMERGLKQTSKGFVFSPSQKVIESLTASEDISAQLADQVETSIFMQDTNTDFKVVMCSPYVEYNIPGYNFTFVKQLSRSEIQLFLSSRFQDWENSCLRILNSIKKFKDALNEINITAQVKHDETTIFHYSDCSGTLTSFKNIKDYKDFKLQLKSENSALSGCIERNGNLGKLELQPFRVSIKGLDSEFDFQHQFKKSDWQHLIGFLQQKSIISPSNPPQIVDRVCNAFKRHLTLPPDKSLTNNLDCLISKKYKLLTDQEAEQMITLQSHLLKPQTSVINQVTDVKGPDGLKSLHRSNQTPSDMHEMRKRFSVDAKRSFKEYTKMQKRSKMLQSKNGRFLVEFSFPQCVLNIRGQTFTKVLSEEDLRYIASKNFADWKNFIITRHFRLELDIGQEKPLPKIAEVTRQDEDFDELLNDRVEEVTLEERTNLDQTRNRLSAWFPA